MARPTVVLDGIRELTAALKAIDAELPRSVRMALNAGAELTVSRAKPLIPKLTGKAARSVKAASTRSDVRIKAGGKRAPWYPWLDFGGKVGRKDSVVRRFYSDGRYLYPEFYKLLETGQFEEALLTELREVIRQAGMELQD